MNTYKFMARENFCNDDKSGVIDAIKIFYWNCYRHCQYVNFIYRDLMTIC